jgi:hypothetical protein
MVDLYASMLTKNSGTMLKCGLHKCPQYCHNLHDHSKMACNLLVKSSCPQKHKITRRCHDTAGAVCRECEAEARKKEELRQRDHQLEQEREAKQKAYANQLAELQAEIEHEKRLMKGEMDDRERQNVLAQHRQDLQKLRNAKKVAENHATSPRATDSSYTHGSSKGHADQQQKSSRSPSPISGNKATNSDDGDARSQAPSDQSDARDDWEYQKNLEGQDNEALDALVGMIGKCRAILVVCFSNFLLQAWSP